MNVGKVPVVWKNTYIVSMYKTKENKDKCTNAKIINSLGKLGILYSKILTERVFKRTESRIREEQREFRNGRGCVDEMFSLKQTVEE